MQADTSTVITEPDRLISQEEAERGLLWLETFYSDDTRVGANARCVGGLLWGMSRVHELEHETRVDGGLTQLEFSRVTNWLGVYDTGRGKMAELARVAAADLIAFADTADPWGEADLPG